MLGLVGETPRVADSSAAGACRILPCPNSQVRVQSGPDLLRARFLGASRGARGLLLVKAESRRSATPEREGRDAPTWRPEHYASFPAGDLVGAASRTRSGAPGPSSAGGQPDRVTAGRWHRVRTTSWSRYIMRTQPRCENCATSASARTASASAKASRSRPTTAGALSEFETVPSFRECRVDGLKASAPTQARQVLSRKDYEGPRR